MEQLLRQVRRAHRRLLVEQALRWLVVCLSVTLGVAAIAIALPKLIVLSGLPGGWNTWWLVGGLSTGILAPLLATWLTRGSALDAAIEIDHRLDLRERVASSLALSPADQQTAAGQALLRDTMRRIERVDVAEKFSPRLGRRAWAPLVPAVLLFGLMLIGNRQAESSVAPSPEQVQTQVKDSAEMIRKTLAEQRKKADQKNLPEATELLTAVEKDLDTLNPKQLQDRKQATLKLNNLAKQLEARRQQLGSSTELQKQLERLPQFGKGPGQKIAQAMQHGDWQKALSEINKLQKQFNEDKLTAAEQKQLAQQLQQLKETLAQAAEAHRQAMQELQKQLQQQRQQGNLQQASQLQQKLDQLQQKLPQMQQLQKLAQQLDQCEQCLQNSDQAGATQALAQMGQQMAQWQQELDEMQMLDQALEQFDLAKAAMNQGCPQCQGLGCQACQGNKPGQPGQGLGAGQGKGPRPEEKNPTQFRDTQVRQKVGRGAIRFGGFVDGPNVAGQSSATLQEELSAIRSEPADPLSSERLPRSRGQHAEEYFQQLREL